jgi:hypothetical protein
MIKATISTLTLLLAFSSTFAQVAGGVHTKLMDLYVLGKFEKCASMAEGMTQKDKYKNESEPYLYMAMCLKKIVEDPELSALEEYKNAKKNAMKYAVKFKKKDDKLRSKGKEYLYDMNIETIGEFVQMGCEEGFSYFVQDNYSKSAYFYNLSFQLNPEDDAVRMMLGVAQLKNGVRDGQKLVDESLTKYKDEAKAGGFEPDEYTAKTFEDAFLYYTDYCKGLNKSTDAERAIQTARELSPENERFKKKYKEIYG